MRLLDEEKQLLSEYGIRPKKKLGQSFCIDEELLKRMVNYANLNENDTVLEVGSGFGFLTHLLSETTCQVIAVEIDSKLLKALKDKVGSRGNVILLQGDILKLELPNFKKVVSNPPYTISSSLMLLLFKRGFERAILTLQREFAEKLTAKFGNRNYGALSVIADYKADVKILERVPQESFYPQPRVESAVVLIESRKKFSVVDETFFFTFVEYLFTLRNRKVRKPLESFLVKEIGMSKADAKIVISSLPFTEVKVCDMKPEDFAVLSDLIHPIVRSKKTVFKGASFYIFPEVYVPSDDTFLLADHLNVSENSKILDICTGSGLLAIVAAKKAKSVVAIDINPYAVRCTKLNSKLNHVDDKVEVIRADLFSGFTVDAKFDFIICNPPYLPVDEEMKIEDWLERSWNGGSTGRKIIDKILDTVSSHIVEGGKLLMIQSSVSNFEESIKILREKGFDVEIEAEKELFFEKVVLIKAEKRI